MIHPTMFSTSVSYPWRGDHIEFTWRRLSAGLDERWWEAEENSADSLAKCIDRVDSCHSNERFVPLYILIVKDSVRYSQSGRPKYQFNLSTRTQNFVMMLTAMDRFYVGKVLDIYKQAASSRYDSVDNATSASSLSYLLRVFFPIQVQAVSYLFILHWHLRLFLVVHRPPLPNLMMAWKKMRPRSPGITMAMSCTLMHQSATWFTILEDLGVER